MTKLTDLIPGNLNMSTADRLRLVADIIETEPEHWNQDTFIIDGSRYGYVEPHPFQVAGSQAREIKCGTTACVAGWGTILTPFDVIKEAVETFEWEGDDDGIEWSKSGAAAFGFDEELAARVFFDFERDAEVMAEKLRLLADLPEPRTARAAVAAGYVTAFERQEAAR